MRKHSDTIQRLCGKLRPVHLLRSFMVARVKANLNIMTIAVMTVFTFGMASPLAHAAESHLNQTITNHVVLIAYCASLNGPCPFNQLSNDGTTGVAEFRIPHGAALVVTDVQFTYTGDPSKLIGDKVVGLVLWRENLSTGKKNSPWFSYNGLEQHVLRDNMTAGFVVSYGSHLLGEYQSPTGTATIVVRGYLTAGSSAAAVPAGTP